MLTGIANVVRAQVEVCQLSWQVRTQDLQRNALNTKIHIAIQNLCACASNATAMEVENCYVSAGVESI